MVKPVTLVYGKQLGIQGSHQKNVSKFFHESAPNSPLARFFHLQVQLAFAEPPLANCEIMRTRHSCALTPDRTSPHLTTALKEMSAFIAGTPVTAKVVAKPIARRNVTVRAAANSEYVRAGVATIGMTHVDFFAFS